MVTQKVKERRSLTEKKDWNMPNKIQMKLKTEKKKERGLADKFSIFQKMVTRYG
jgi:hypothetical protein